MQASHYIVKKIKHLVWNHIKEVSAHLKFRGFMCSFIKSPMMQLWPTKFLPLKEKKEI